MKFLPALEAFRAAPNFNIPVGLSVDSPCEPSKANRCKLLTVDQTLVKGCGFMYVRGILCACAVWYLFRYSVSAVTRISASMGNKLRHNGLPIQLFHMLHEISSKSCDRSQSDVYAAVVTQHMETYGKPPDPSLCVILKRSTLGLVGSGLLDYMHNWIV